jgi:hypothetical protein
MASKPTENTAKEAPDTTVPASVIAQAEAAIVGNFEDDEFPKSRRPSRAPKQDFSQYQHTNRPSTAGEGSSR